MPRKLIQIVMASTTIRLKPPTAPYTPSDQRLFYGTMSFQGVIRMPLVFDMLESSAPQTLRS